MTVDMVLAANELEATGVLEGEITRTWVAEDATLRIVVHQGDMSSVKEAIADTSMPELFEIVGSPYSYTELQSEMTRLVGSAPTGDTLIVSASPYADTGAGLKIGVFRQDAAEDRGTRVATSEAYELAAAVAASVPVTFVWDEPQSIGIGRQEGSLPISGGARMYNTDGGACSTGIGYIRSPQTGESEFAAVMLTADHCGDSGDTWETDGAGTIGSMQSFYSGGADLKWIIHPNVNDDIGDAANSIFQPRIYTGSYTSATHVPVYGRVTPALQMEVCYAGSYSGTVCGAEVIEVNTTYLSFGGAGGVVYTSGARTASAASNPPFGNGDSGGVVYMPVSNPQGDGGMVMEIGSSYNGLSPEPCLGVPSGAGRVCSSDSYFAAESAIANRLPDGYAYTFVYNNPIPPRIATDGTLSYDER